MTWLTTTRGDRERVGSLHHVARAGNAKYELWKVVRAFATTRPAVELQTSASRFGMSLYEGITTIFRIQGVFTEPYDTGIVLRVNAEVGRRQTHLEKVRTQGSSCRPMLEVEPETLLVRGPINTPLASRQSADVIARIASTIPMTRGGTRGSC